MSGRHLSHRFLGSNAGVPLEGRLSSVAVVGGERLGSMPSLCLCEVLVLFILRRRSRSERCVPRETSLPPSESWALSLGRGTCSTWNGSQLWVARAAAPPALVPRGTTGSPPAVGCFWPQVNLRLRAFDGSPFDCAQGEQGKGSSQRFGQVCSWCAPSKRGHPSATHRLRTG